MKTLAFDRKFWVISLIWTICHVLGVLADVETLTTPMMPSDVLAALRKANGSEILEILNNTRRIILGRESNKDRPYMVYLKLPTSSEKFQDYKAWLCGGIIVHELYILTSAACIEDVKHFYVVSGTHKFSFSDDRYNNLCIKNGAKKAIWKCIPRNYIFDGHENDNIRWMNNDIAVVMLEDEFDFTRRVRGCDYAPRPVCYNNQSVSYEAAGTVGAIAGWGSTDKYNDWVNSRRSNTRRDFDNKLLLEVNVEIQDKATCKKRWGKRYHNIIDNYMICTRDMSAEVSEICLAKYVDCQDIDEDDSAENNRRAAWDPEKMQLHSAHHHNESRRQQKNLNGGFCENDHGGPLVVGEGVNTIAVGIISACLVKEKTNKCYGPFLYTSIYKNRVLINCAIYKDAGLDCNKLFRSSVTHTEVKMDWTDHPDGPAKSEVKALRRKDEMIRLQGSLNNGTTTASANDTSTPANKSMDSVVLHAGVIVRSHNEEEDAAPLHKIKHINGTKHKNTTHGKFSNVMKTTGVPVAVKEIAVEKTEVPVKQ